MWKVTRAENGNLLVTTENKSVPGMRASVHFLPGPMRLAAFAATALELSGILTGHYERVGTAEGRDVSCRKGCGACCRQPVPISPAEAFLLAELVASFPPAKRKRTEALFRKGLNRVMTEMEDASPFDSASRYFRLGIACPFLVRESCSIHSVRPAVCREHLVVSPASHCAEFPHPGITLLSMNAPVRQALSELSSELLGWAPTVIPLVAALQWAEENREWGRREWDSDMLVDFLVAKMGVLR
jgi:Fe-S-cluster containining protein